MIIPIILSSVENVDSGNIWTIIVNNIILPLAIAIITSIGVILQKYIQQALISIKSKNDKSSLESLTNIVSATLSQLELIVSNAVCNNIKFAEEFKKANEDGKLTQEEQDHLKSLALQLIQDTLPSNIRSGKLNDLLGGNEAINKLISNMVETKLLDIKVKVSNSTKFL